MQKFRWVRWVSRMEHNDPEKEAYRVGEVSQVVSIDPYVLRYWEKMFPQLKPRKDETGQRIYTKSDIDTVLRIKTLLYEERFTIAGAKKKLSEEIKSLENNDELVEVLHNVKETLKEISDILSKK
jgi:DNA-binding transcriptional MerR regulator